MKVYVNYLFEDCDEESDWCGDWFFVRVEDTPDAKDNAISEAMGFCAKPKILGVYNDNIAEQMGYDTY